MTNPTNKLQISFGVLSPLIAIQLEEQGFVLDMTPVQRSCLQKSIENVSYLRIHGILTAADANKTYRRILRTIQKHARPL
jgi:hypothetical protein